MSTFQVKIWFQNRRMKWKRSKKSPQEHQRRPGEDKRTDNDISSDRLQSNVSDNVDLFQMDDDSDIDIDDVDSDSNDENIMTIEGVSKTHADLLCMNQSEFTPNQYNMLQPRQVSTS
jgi:hypothetical protein